MYYKCCVPGCVSSGQKNRLHKIPKCEKRLQTWLDSINCNSLRNQSVVNLVHLQVCHKHFEARFVTKKPRLLSTAYPTLLLESEIISGVPVKPFEVQDSFVKKKDNKVIHNDHNYKNWKKHMQQIQAPIELNPLTSTSSDHSEYSLQRYLLIYGA